MTKVEARGIDYHGATPTPYHNDFPSACVSIEDTCAVNFFFKS